MSALGLVQLSSLGLLGERARGGVMPFPEDTEWLMQAPCIGTDPPCPDGGEDGVDDEFPEPLPFDRHTTWDEYPPDTLPGLDEEAPSDAVLELLVQDIEELERRQRDHTHETDDDDTHSL
jgi:hypothetical protein